MVIDKDWLSFGHQFGRRLGQFTEHDLSNRSPIFLQFLDAIRIILRGIPNKFEFNEKLLLFLAESLQCGKYGTWLLNNDKERRAAGVRDSTISVWVQVQLLRAEFSNPKYVESDRIAIYSCPDVKDISVWKEYFLKYRN